MGLFRLRLVIAAFCVAAFLPQLRAMDVCERLSALCEPAKLATLSRRGAIPRVQKIVYWLEISRREGYSPVALLRRTMKQIGWDDDRGRMTTEALLRNLQIATKLGCTDDDGMSEMRRGRAPTVRAGPYAGDQLSVDHIVPVSRFPELDNVLANLELMPLRLNMRKGDAMGRRQFELLVEFRAAGFLSGSNHASGSAYLDREQAWACAFIGILAVAARRRRQ